MEDVISVDPDICNGKPVFRGTRITVQTVFEFLSARALWFRDLESRKRSGPDQCHEGRGFSHRIAASPPPPRVVHVRVGNMRLQPFQEFLESTWAQIESHFPTSKLIEVHADRIEVVSW